MRNYYRVMLGKGSSYAAECFAGPLALAQSPPEIPFIYRHLAELVVLRNAPEERTNLGTDPRHARRVGQLQRELTRLLRSTRALPDRMPLDEGIKQELPDQKIR